MEATFNVNIIGDRTPNPSPNDYEIKGEFGKVPPIFIHQRPVEYPKRTDPALVNLPTYIGKVPKINMHLRCPGPRPFVPPGPSYVPPPLGKDAPKVGFVRARLREKKVVTPGPSDYYKSKDFGTDSPRTAIRCGPRDRLWGAGYSPGPAAYKVRYEKTRANSPAWSIKNRYELRKDPPPQFLMGPRSTLTGPKFSMCRSGRPDIIHA